MSGPSGHDAHAAEAEARPRARATRAGRRAPPAGRRTRSPSGAPHESPSASPSASARYASGCEAVRARRGGSSRSRAKSSSSRASLGDDVERAAREEVEQAASRRGASRRGAGGRRSCRRRPGAASGCTTRSCRRSRSSRRAGSCSARVGGGSPSPPQACHSAGRERGVRAELEASGATARRSTASGLDRGERRVPDRHVDDPRERDALVEELPLEALRLVRVTPDPLRRSAASRATRPRARRLPRRCSTPPGAAGSSRS